MFSNIKSSPCIYRQKLFRTWTHHCIVVTVQKQQKGFPSPRRDPVLNVEKGLSDVRLPEFSAHILTSLCPPSSPAAACRHRKRGRGAGKVLAAGLHYIA